ncbi:MAG: hypothetical protein M0Q93_11610 [Terrimicrobiaceae bacterium]|nr:hypothetical protein [Terrimicrobiaceae bacterium]
MPIGDATEGPKVADRFLKTGIRGGYLGKGLGLPPFVHVLSRDLVNVEIGVMGPQQVRTVRAIAPEQADRTGLVSGKKIEADSEVLRELGVLAEKDPERMLAVRGFNVGPDLLEIVLQEVNGVRVVIGFQQEVEFLAPVRREVFGIAKEVVAPSFDEGTLLETCLPITGTISQTFSVGSQRHSRLT